MQRRQLIKGLAAGAIVSTLLPAFAAEPVTLKVGASPLVTGDILEFVKPALAKKGINLKIIEFTDYIQPNLALADKEIDANLFQHKPFMDKFCQDRGLKLTALPGIFIAPIALYSKKIKDVKELKKGDTITIPNDPTNGGRGLQLLEKAGLIKLKEGAGFKATLADVVDNPKHLQFKELEAAQLPRSIDDLDAATITMNYVMSAGLDPAKQCIFLEDKDAPLALMVIAARPDNKDSEAVQKFVKAYHSDEVKKFIADKYKGTIVPGWS